MSLYDYRRSIMVSDEPFYALIMAAMRKADDVNIEKLRDAWPDVWEELRLRYHAPGGYLAGERPPQEG